LGGEWWTGPKVRGPWARGGFEVDLRWEAGNRFTVRHGGKTRTIKAQAARSRRLDAILAAE
jgi:hypothetical protein